MDWIPHFPPPPFSDQAKLFTEESWAQLTTAVSHTLETGEPYELELNLVRADGSLGWMVLHGEVVFDDDDAAEKVGLQGVAQDITERKAAEAKIHQLALSDSLTGVANRRAFYDHVDHSIRMSERHGGKSVLVLLDLDDFKIINDSYGHAAGDAILENVASILKRQLRKTDIVARLGGDEFALFFNKTTDDFDLIDKLNTIIATIEKAIVVDGQPVKARVSGGIACYPDDADNKVDLLKCADLALYEAKKTAGSAYETYRKGMTFKYGENI